MHENIVLVCKSVWYYSSVDEELFFTWIKRIPSIIKHTGAHDALYLHASGCTIPDKDLREIISLLYRYKIDMKQLQIFLNDNNKEWFYDKPKGYWYKRVFGAQKNQE